LPAPAGRKTKREIRVLREFDFTIITRGDLTEGDHAKAIGGYEALMTKDGGEIIKKDEWGNRKLAFPINKSFRGIYVNYDFVGTPENVAEMERLMRIDDNVLRHLIVRIDDSAEGIVDIEARKAELAKAERDARERDLEQQKRRKD
jgi:small subunit ribosomal protein S6